MGGKIKIIARKFQIDRLTSFYAFKTAMSVAGEGMAWHYIVE